MKQLQSISLYVTIFTYLSGCIVSKEPVLNDPPNGGVSSGVIDLSAAPKAKRFRCEPLTCLMRRTL